MGDSAAMTLTAAILDVDPFGDRLRRRARARGCVVLVAFTTSFLAIRTSARLTRSVSWWPGGVETEDGTHLHHLVWGICLVLICGFLAFAVPATAALAGTCSPSGSRIGAGFSARRVRALGPAAGRLTGPTRAAPRSTPLSSRWRSRGSVVLGTTPFGLDDPGSIGGTVAVVVLVLGLSIVSFLKGRLFLGVLGLFIPVFGAVGALRLGEPTSIWARRRYSTEQLTEAKARFAPDRRGALWRRRMSDLIAGAPSRDDA